MHAPHAPELDPGAPMDPQRVPAIGDQAPDFRLKGPDGQFVTLSEFRGHNHVVLVFFPLAFSPICSHQLPGIERAMPRLRELGADVLGVSVDSHYANGVFGNRLRLTFPLLSDFKREASRAYGVLLGEPGFSNRALFLIDRDGRLVYRDVSPDPSTVPSNEALIEALEKLGN
jgi:peroxiredoxin